MKPLPVTALLAAVVLSAAPTLAAGEEPRSVAVNLAGVDLDSDAGAAHALRRIERAAQRVCEVRHGRQPIDVRAATRACAREATERAVADLDAPLVNARFATNTRLAEGLQRRSR